MGPTGTSISVRGIVGRNGLLQCALKLLRAVGANTAGSVGLGQLHEVRIVQLAADLPAVEPELLVTPDVCRARCR